MRIGVSIVKKCTFRDSEQEFSNDYYFSLETAVTAPSEPIVDEIVTREKTFHSTGVTFVRAKVWTAGGTKAENQMIFQKNLSGTGATANGPEVDRERAVLVRCPAGFDSRGLQVYFRKWYHACGPFGATGIQLTGLLGNTTGFSQAARDAIAAAVQPLKNVGANLWGITSAKGRQPTGDFQAHKYLEHHQLGDQWR